MIESTIIQTKEIETIKLLKDANDTLIGYLINNTKSVPLVEDNRDYQRIQKWLEKGNRAIED